MRWDITQLLGAASTVPRCRASSRGTRPGVSARECVACQILHLQEALPPPRRASPSSGPGRRHLGLGAWVLEAAEGLLGQVDAVHHDLVHQALAYVIGDGEAVTVLGSMMPSVQALRSSSRWPVMLSTRLRCMALSDVHTFSRAICVQDAGQQGSCLPLWVGPGGQLGPGRQPG